ncbi:MAG: hypothetical protein EA397_19145 [Deltaproteobacteria bacterium]|nr:MAG: hypothetical protein EA397_19145 [Deltaproteobacteria bacterium]
MFLFLLLPLVLGAPAVAGESSDASTASASESARKAEYKRLHEEFQRLVKRNAWSGAERTYQAMLETGVEPAFEDLKTAAQVAQAFGRVHVVHERLVAASKLQEDKEVLEALWAIDDNYGQVYLAGNPGEATLRAQKTPFDPTHARAVEHAVETVEKTGMFDGLLPKGVYEFSGREVDVRPRVSQQRIDLRTDEGIRKSRRALRKADRAD